MKEQIMGPYSDIKSRSLHLEKGVIGPSQADVNWANGFHKDEKGGAKTVTAIIVGGSVLAVWGGTSLIDATMNHDGPAPIVRSAVGSPTPTPSPTEMPSPTVKVNQAPTVTGECPTVETALQTTVEVGGFGLAGFPTRATNVLVAESDGRFKNPFPSGTSLSAAYGEPGAILYGPDIVGQSNSNPFGDGRPNPGPDAVYNSHGHARFLTDETHRIADTCPPLFRLIPASGFLVFNGQEGVIEIGKSDETGKWVSTGKKIVVKEEQGTQAWVAIRGLFGDGKQDTDENLIARITGFVPSSAQVFEFFNGEDPATGNVENSAFISAEWFEQNIANAHKSGPNGGDAGNSRVKSLVVDANTGAYGVDIHTSTRENARDWHNMANGWSPSGNNFR